MRIIKRATAALASVAVVAGLSACADEATQVQDPISTVSAEVTPSTVPTVVESNTEQEVAAEHNDADVTFAQMMTIHHVGALEMSELAVEKGDSDELRGLAATIQAAQGPEIELMESWLTSWDEPLEPAGHEGMDHGGMDMDGMSQEQVMDELRQASGSEFDKQFLTSMIAHHEGAVMMSEEELRDGQNPDALELAQQIIDAQESEIQEMQQLLQGT